MKSVWDYFDELFKEGVVETRVAEIPMETFQVNYVRNAT